MQAEPRSFSGNREDQMMTGTGLLRTDHRAGVQKYNKRVVMQLMQISAGGADVWQSNVSITSNCPRQNVTSLLAD